MKTIDPNSLVDIWAEAQRRGIPLRVDLIYADAAHPLNQTFKTAIYRRDAKLWLYQDLAEIVLLAAKNCHAQHGLTIVATDGLRPTEAQQAMADTPLVRAHPEWTAPGDGMLISPPGFGAHPRAMAIDLMLQYAAGNTIDMGTALDHFSTDPNDNPAARDYPGLSTVARANRKILDDAMMDAARTLGTPLHLLSSEWWDFRLPVEIYNQYAPLSDRDLPPAMRMCL